MENIKIFKTAESESLSDWELKKVEQLRATFFVYNYKNYGYEGSGWAVWDMPDGMYGYTSLGHCSCNGPVDDLNSIPYDIEGLRKIAGNYNTYAPAVIEMVEGMKR